MAAVTDSKLVSIQARNLSPNVSALSNGIDMRTLSKADKLKMLLDKTNGLTAEDRRRLEIDSRISFQEIQGAERKDRCLKIFLALVLLLIVISSVILLKHYIKP